MKSLYTVSEVESLIKSGRRLILAGEEKLLSALPKGDWVGGTIPYFMSEKGGVETDQFIQVSELPPEIQSVVAKAYSAEELKNIPKDYPNNGVSFIMIPAFSKAHSEFATYCSTYPGLFDRPLLGWVTGYGLNSSESKTPKTFNGLTGESYADKAVVLHLNLHESKFGKVNIINLFEQSQGDKIVFTETGFESQNCLINGKPVNLYSYIKEKGIDTKLPLVANYSGAMINVSIMAMNYDKQNVSFYAPVFKDVEYRFANPVASYEKEFEQKVKDLRLDKPTLSCNCILNYLYANLEGKKTANVLGPMTFGEIAYMLLNQTMVYITFEDKK